MKILIATDDLHENIGVIKEYTPIDSKGEIAQFIVELEIIKEELIDLWKEYVEKEDGREF